MTLHHCPKCRKKTNQESHFCVHCGFSFTEESLLRFQQEFEQRQLNNQQLNRQNAKLQCIWLIIFSLVIGLASWWIN